MGKHTEELKIIIERKIAAKNVDYPVAIQLLRRRIERAISQYGDEIDEIVAFTDGELTPFEKNKVTGLEGWIRIELERLQDLADLAPAG